MDASTSLVDEYARLPLCARALVPYALVIGFVLNPLFSLDDFVAFCPGDILRRAQFHRVFASLLYIEGAFSALRDRVGGVSRRRALGAFARHVEDSLSDAVAASVLANATATCFATIAGPFAPAVFEVNFLGGTGVFTSCFVLFTREIARAPANTDLATPFGVAMPAKRAPYVTAVILVFLGGCNPLEVLACLYVGNAWAANGMVWATSERRYALAQLENGALRFASRQPGYVAVNGQMLPVVSRDRSLAIVLAQRRARSSKVWWRWCPPRRARRDADSAETANRSAAPAAATTPAAPATADDAPSASRGVDTRPKPQTREERAAAFAAAFERRNADDADDARRLDASVSRDVVRRRRRRFDSPRHSRAPVRTNERCSRIVGVFCEARAAMRQRRGHARKHAYSLSDVR